VEQNKQKSFEEMLNESFKMLQVGKIVKGTVIVINENEIILDLGFKSDGVISRANFSDCDLPLSKQVKIGDEIEAVILKLDDSEGAVVLSKKRLELQLVFEKVEKAFKSGEIIQGKVIHIVKSGMIVLVDNQVKLFIPASHLPEYGIAIEAYLDKFVNFKVIEFDHEQHRYVGSCKKHILEGSSEDPFEIIKIGDKFEGPVTRIADFGIFVGVLGISALVHVSEISWEKDCDFKQKFAVGDIVTVFIINVDKELRRLSLSMKDPKQNPWLGIEEKYPPGKIITGKVLRISNYGAFIEIEPLVDGLLHISQIANEKVDRVNEKLSVGDIITVRVIEANSEKKRISLSMIDIQDQNLKSN